MDATRIRHQARIRAEVALFEQAVDREKVLPPLVEAVSRALPKQDLWLLGEFDLTSLLNAYKALPIESAQALALLSLAWATVARYHPGSRRRALAQARTCAIAALTAPVPSQSPPPVVLPAINECQDDLGNWGLFFGGYATRFNEVDQEDEALLPDALYTRIWSDLSGPILLSHGKDTSIGRRQLTRAVFSCVDDIGLRVDAFLPRHPDPRVFVDKALDGYRRVYLDVQRGIIDAFSIGPSGPSGQGYRVVDNQITQWVLGEVSLTDGPCLLSATFTLDPDGWNRIRLGRITDELQSIKSQIAASATAA